MRILNFIKPFLPVHLVWAVYVSALLLALPATQATAATTETFSSVSCTYSPHLSCINTQSGETLWQNLLYSDPDNFTIQQARLYISHSTTSSSFNVHSGKLVWQVSSDSDARYFYPVLSGDVVYLARSDGTLEKRQANSGDLIWSRSLSDAWVYPPIVQQDTLLTGGQNRTLWALDAQTGQVRDSVSLSQELVAPLFQSNNLFVSSTFDGKLSAFSFDLPSGQIQPAWALQLDAPAFSYLSDFDYFVAADMGGKLSSVDPQSGQLLWQKTVHQNALFWNTLYRQRLISLTESGLLTILDINNGKLLKQTQFNRQYIQAPIVHGDKVALYDITGAVQHLALSQSLLISTSRGIIQ